MTRLRTRAAILCSLMLFAGCAVVLDASSDLGPHCRFDGDEDTTCGACVSSYCQAEVDACCGDAECADDLDALDDCAGGDVLGCLDLYVTSGPLGECMEARCLSACDPYASDSGGGGASELIAVCTVGEVSCVCTVEAEAGQSTASCSSSDILGGACCADPGYPAAGLGCGCFTAECVDHGTFCECGFYDAEGSDSVSCSSLYEVCCFDPVELTCLCEDAGQCVGNEMLVESCSAFDLGCPSELEEVSSCDL